ncbi:GntR family transcriptional regulator [Streptomyces sp. NPDC058459]|uniref:GntR family transcriptional regulator n=1 Tax=Streptomyces sp. NPDC058459 TaxID=3346508 RepID=UPI0036468CDB
MTHETPATGTTADVAGTGSADKATKHERLRQSLRGDIDKLEPHTALPTERELAARHEVSRSTVRQALDALADAGIVYRVHGAGTFVAAQTISKSHSLTSFTEDMQARGLTPGTRLIAADETTAGRQIAEELRTTPDHRVVRLIRLRTADDRPMCLETVHLRADRVPGLLAHDLNISLYDILQTRYQLRLVRAEQVWTAVSLDERSAILLGVPAGAAAFHVRRVGLDERGRPQEATTSLYRADRYDVHMTVQRGTR